VTDQLYRDFTQKAEASKAMRRLRPRRTNIRVVGNGDASLRGKQPPQSVPRHLIASVISPCLA